MTSIIMRPTKLCWNNCFYCNQKLVSTFLVVLFLIRAMKF